GCIRLKQGGVRRKTSNLGWLGGFRNESDGGIGLALGECRVVSRMNAFGQQMERRRSRDQLLQFVCKGVRLSPGRQKYHSWFSAELSGPHGERSVECCRNGVTSFSQGARQNEDRIGAAHFRVERNRLRARGCNVHQDSSRGAGPGKTTGFHERVLHQGGTDLGPTAKQQ